MPSSSSVGARGNEALRADAATASASSRPALNERERGRRIDHVVDLAGDKRQLRGRRALAGDVNGLDAGRRIEHNAEEVL